ncbi:helix-turn-helix transcriptional regulator [Rhodanobacter sp. 7MK24]|nr:helix-turn-helix transcriptional regulator [Rhodanobacter sp. 7MK24]
MAYIPARAPADASSCSAIYLHVPVCLEVARKLPPDVQEIGAERVLGSAILAALTQGCRGAEPFVRHLVTALCSLRQAHAVAGDSQTESGGLRPWQATLAKNMLISGMDGSTLLADVAAACGLSKSHFGKAFRRSVGMPPHRWIVMQRLERAQQLLRDASRSLAAVAAECGFCDQSHMSHVFLKTLGLSPGAYRCRDRAAMRGHWPESTSATTSG